MGDLVYIRLYWANGDVDETVAECSATSVLIHRDGCARRFIASADLDTEGFPVFTEDVSLERASSAVTSFAGAVVTP